MAYLREHYGTMSVREIANALQRPYRGITLKAHKEGLRTRDSGRPWTDADSAYLREHYESMPTMEIAAALGRRHAIIKVQADKLGY